VVRLHGSCQNPGVFLSESAAVADPIISFQGNYQYPPRIGGLATVLFWLMAGPLLELLTLVVARVIVPDLPGLIFLLILGTPLLVALWPNYRFNRRMRDVVIFDPETIEIVGLGQAAKETIRHRRYPIRFLPGGDVIVVTLNGREYEVTPDSYGHLPRKAGALRPRRNQGLVALKADLLFQ
jgi:hypothetical protein